MDSEQQPERQLVSDSLFSNYNEDGHKKNSGQSSASTTTTTTPTSSTPTASTPTSSTTPPLLVLPPSIIYVEPKEKDCENQKMQVDKDQTNNDNLVRAMIETSDPSIMSKIVNTIKQLYPEINIQMFANESKSSCKANERLKKDEEKSYLGPIEAVSSRNSLSTNYIADKKISDRASSIDNSSLTSMERQESKDSGFWSMSKCSFESMKSLSISDSSHPNEASAAAVMAASYRPAVNTDPEKLHQNSLSPTSSHKNELNVSRRFLKSPTNKSSMYNWKKGI